ncbi:MAG: hypothetical protein J6S67_01145 [Methanobrevibacter sp.]|nr:hypothetical protein [Methanobrevibacter sp.]
MSRFDLIKDERKPINVRKAFESFYINKFFNKWMKKFKFKGLDYQESYYVMKKFWFEGTVAASLRLNPESVADQLPKLVYTPWVFAQKYNCYDFPTHARCINTRGVSYINTEELEVDKGIVIGWCQANHKGIYSLIAPKIAQLVDLEMVIRVCTKNQKAPWVIAMSPEDKKAIDKFVEDLESDEPVLITMLNDLKNAKSLASAAPFILDKLEPLRQKIEDDIKTLVGISNVGIAQKKEHFTDDEVQANNSEIEETSEEYLDEIQAFFDRGNKAFGTNNSVSLSYEIDMDYNEDEEEEKNEQID